MHYRSTHTCAFFFASIPARIAGANIRTIPRKYDVRVWRECEEFDGISFTLEPARLTVELRRESCLDGSAVNRARGGFKYAILS